MKARDAGARNVALALEGEAGSNSRHWQQTVDMGCDVVELEPRGHVCQAVPRCDSK